MYVLFSMYKMLQERFGGLRAASKLSLSPSCVFSSSVRLRGVSQKGGRQRDTRRKSQAEGEAEGETEREREREVCVRVGGVCRWWREHQ